MMKESTQKIGKRTTGLYFAANAAENTKQLNLKSHFSSYGDNLRISIF